jgi:DNA invertase Pin-like site-specific DNA recombinase
MVKTTTATGSRKRATAKERREAIAEAERKALAESLPKWTRPEDGRHRIGYVRVSTDDQTNVRQIAAIVEAGVHPDDVFSDTASGRDQDRPGWKALWKDLQKDDILVVHSIDRLGRNLGELALTLEAIHKKEADLYVVQMPIDFRTPIGQFIFGQLASFAHFERIYSNERTKDGLRRAREAGRQGGRTARNTPERILHLHDELGATKGAEAAEMTRQGFLKAVKRARQDLEDRRREGG